MPWNADIPKDCTEDEVNEALRASGHPLFIARNRSVNWGYSVYATICGVTVYLGEANHQRPCSPGVAAQGVRDQQPDFLRRAREWSYRLKS
jgi:hypothetical protein